MIRIKHFIAISAGILLSWLNLYADEGMRTLRYDNDGRAVNIEEVKPIVSIGFYGTGSIISRDGLMITNHHVAYGDIHALSTPENNILKNGFWAKSRAEEIPVPGAKVFMIQDSRIVTKAEFEAIRQDLKSRGQNYGKRRVLHLIEVKASKESGLEAVATSFNHNEFIVIDYYKVYTDVRLVAAPPESIASFGGDTDNWEWPQYKCDFTMYRIYDNGKPLEFNQPLKVSTAGYGLGTRTKVIGYPGHTNRYASSFQTDYQQRIVLPIETSLERAQIEIIRKWMNQDEGIRLKYSETFFGLSNVAELKEGELECLERFDVRGMKRAEEKMLPQECSSILEGLGQLYRQDESVEKSKIYFRETLVKGAIIWRTMMRMSNAQDTTKLYDILQKGMAETDPRVEKELVRYSIEQFYENVPAKYYGKFQKKLRKRFGKDYDALTDYLWDDSFVSSEQRARAFTGVDELKNDKLNRFRSEIKIDKFSKPDPDKQRLAENLRRDYAWVIQDLRTSQGKEVFYDANSTIRINEGKVCEFFPREGVELPYMTTTEGITRRYNESKYEFCPPSDFMHMLDSKMPVDFLTDNDITGGNSGSPVLNDKGEVIGLAFDGNKESLASDLAYVPGYNNCVCVDIRYVLWVLTNYGHLDYLAQEIQFAD